MPDLVNLTIDGVAVRAAAGTRLLWAALDAGIAIPHLCAIREAEPPWGGCRLCFVEVEGEAEPVTACSEPIAEGMVVRTNSPRVARLRRTALELLLALEPNRCAECVKQGRCELVAVRDGIGLRSAVIERIERPLPIDDSNPFFIHDPNYCILCGRCIWACQERQGAHALDFAGRGFDTEVRPFDGLLGPYSRCESCGECVARCPTAALVPKGLVLPDRETPSVCPLCAVGCGLRLGVRDGVEQRIAVIDGDDADPTSRGSLCAKGRFGLIELVHSAERLTTPLLRDATTGELAPASWDEALRFVADKLAAMRGRLGIIASGMLTTEALHGLHELAAATGSGGVAIGSRAVLGLAQEGLRAVFGGAPPLALDDLESAGCILVLGSNVTACHPIVGQRVRAAARRGADVFVVDAQQTDLCSQSRVFDRQARFGGLMVRPGSDALLLAGMIRVILDEGLADCDFIAARCDGFDAHAAGLESLSLDAVAAATGVPRDHIVAAARAYATRRPAAILIGSGVARQGRDAAIAAANLALLAGNVGPGRGGIALLLGQANAWSALAALEQSPDRPPSPSVADVLRATQDGELRGLYVVGADPVRSAPGGKFVADALRRLELLVVQDLYLTATARLAHAVLPAASMAEQFGTLADFQGRARRSRAAIRPIGGARPDAAIVAEMVRCLGVPPALPETSAYSPPSPDDDGRAPEAHKRWRFLPFAATAPSAPDAAFPFVGVAQRSLYHFGTMTQRTTGLSALGGLAGEPSVAVNVADAAALGIGDGDVVRVVSRWGELRLPAQVGDAVPPGVVGLSPHSTDQPLNRLTAPDADPATTPRVRLERL